MLLLMLLLMLYVLCSLIERGKYAEGWEALREIRGPFYEDTYSEFMSIVRAAAAAPKVLTNKLSGWTGCVASPVQERWDALVLCSWRPHVIRP